MNSSHHQNYTQIQPQRGFTRDTCSMSAALILHEKMLEAKENRQQCFVAFLDAKAAFDVVPHASLLRKLANSSTVKSKMGQRGV
jgi:hypothetical protein